MTDSPRAFLSYARADGEAFARQLRERLESQEPEITLWQDRSDMEGGVGWWRQIEEALDKVSYLIIVMTPAALRSPSTGKEWRRARQAGVCVYPVKGVPDDQLDYESLPRWMRKTHFFDLDKEWDTFTRHLKSPCQATRVPFMAPELRSDFVSRPRQLEDLRRRVLGGETADAPAVTTALHGAGGFGKTTLASAFCHLDDVIDSFDDGILWATLGQEPNLRLELTRLYAALTGERPVFVDAEDAALELARALENRNCLIVLDDAWSPAHLKPFLRGGKGCARLVTTRQFEVAASAGRVPVDEMEPSEAVQLLVGALPSAPRDLSGFRPLAKRLGEWPVLLKLAAASLRQRVERGETVEQALVYLNRAFDRRGVTAFDRSNAAERSDAVARTLEVSLDLLTDAERVRLAELAIFPEDAEIRLSAVSTLWDLDPFDTEELVQKLDGQSLLDFDLPRGCLRLHDVFRAYLASQLEEPAALHSRLVEAWGDPYALPDAYAWGFLSYHLVGAGREADLRRLLLDCRWIEAKLGSSDLGSLLADYERSPLDPPLRLLQAAIRLSAHVVSQDRHQLIPQLLGRIPREEAELRSSIEGEAKRRRAPWLRPRHPTLTAAGGPLLRTLAGHRAWVTALSVLPDDTRIVSGSGDGTLKVWDLESGAELAVWDAHADWVTALAVVAGPGTTRVLSGSADGTLTLWDLERSEVVRRWDAHRNWLRAVVVTPGGDRCVSASHDRSLKVWDVSSGRELATWTGHAERVTTAAITPDGHRIVSGSDDRTLRVWDVDGGRELAILSGHEGWIRAVALSPDGHSIVSGALDGVIRVWDLDDGRERLSWLAHASGIGALAVSPDGRLVLSASDDGTLALWGIEDGQRVAVLEGHTDLVRAAAITADGTKIVSGSVDGTIKVWDVDVAVRQRSTRCLSGEIASLAVASRAGRIVAGTRAGLRLFDLASGELLAAGDSHGGRVRAVVVTPDGTRVVSGGEDQLLRIWHLGTGHVLKTLAGHRDRITALAVTSDSRRLASGSHDGVIKIWDLDDGAQLWSWQAHLRWITALAVTADGRMLVSTSHDRTARVWDLESGRELIPALGQPQWITAAAITRSGRRLLSGSADGTLTLWDLLTGDEILKWTGHAAEVMAVAVLPDGQLAISGSGDRTVTIWQLASGEEVTAFHADSPVRAIAVTEDLTIAVGEVSGRLHLLRLENA